jgi:hypothetical protein
MDPILLDRAVVINATQSELEDVHITHLPTQITGAANRILPGAAFDLGFSRQPLRADRAIAEWTQSGGGSFRQELRLQFDPPGADTTATLVYTIGNHGRIDVKISTERNLP